MPDLEQKDPAEELENDPASSATENDDDKPITLTRRELSEMINSGVEQGIQAFVSKQQPGTQTQTEDEDEDADLSIYEPKEIVNTAVNKAQRSIVAQSELAEAMIEELDEKYGDYLTDEDRKVMTKRLKQSSIGQLKYAKANDEHLLLAKAMIGDKVASGKLPVTRKTPEPRTPRGSAGARSDVSQAQMDAYKRMTGKDQMSERARKALINE